MSTYRVELRQVLSASDRQAPVGLERVIALPFVPFVGLSLLGLTVSESPLTLASVAWDTQSQGFSCTLEDFQGEELSTAEILAEYGSDWQVWE